MSGQTRLTISASIMGCVTVLHLMYGTWFDVIAWASATALIFWCASILRKSN
jgi:uncharacterized membrane protein YjjP (DUF1212 family)